MSCCYLTFDIGTTALKTALVDDQGQLQALHVEEYALLTPRPDWAEMSPERYWQAAVTGARAVFSQTHLSPTSLAAIGFSSQGQTFVPVGPNGEALANAIVWVDNRAQAIADAWETSWLSREEFRQSSGYPFIPAGLTLFKLAWLAQHTPEAHRARAFLQLPDYLIYRMTGEMATDRIIAHFSGLYDLRTGDWSPRLLEAAGITTTQLPRILEPGTVAGAVHADAAEALGIPCGTPVCVGCNDQLAGALGAGNIRPGQASETTGTALALVVTTETLLDDTRFCVGRHPVPGISYAMAFGITSAIVLKWLRDLCAPREEYAHFLAGVDAVPPGCDGLTMLPHFAGTACPTFNPDARGVFAGLTLGHTQAHLARAVMEACACMLYECLEAVLDHGRPLQSIRSLGGAARSDTWLQIKADLLGIPVERPQCADAASLGAAMMAATGTGQFATLVDACDAWYHPCRVFAPRAEITAIYRDVYQQYRQLYQRLYGETLPVPAHQ